jgi:hypothetical protein
LTGDVTGTTGSFNGSANVSAATTIANSAVTNAKLANDIDAAKLTTGTLPIDRIADGAISTQKIADGSVTAAKIDPLAKIGGATGAGTDRTFYENDQSVNTDYTITTNKNAMSAGPITVASGVTVTVPDGSTWTIV